MRKQLLTAGLCGLGMLAAAEAPLLKLTAPAEFKNQVVAEPGIMTQGYPLTLDGVTFSHPDFELSVGGDLDAGGGKVPARRETVTLRNLPAKLNAVYLGGLTGHKRLGALTADNRLTLENCAVGTVFIGHEPKLDQLVDGNIDIVVNGGSVDAVTDQGRRIGWITGGLQLLVNRGAAVNAFTLKTQPGGGVWQLYSPKEGALEPTERAGTFRVAAGSHAAATDRKTRGIWSSLNATLTVPSGIYDVAYAGEPVLVPGANETIRVAAPVKLEVSTLPTPERKGKLFLGWTDASGQPLPNGSPLATGTVLTPKFLPYDAEKDFTVDSATAVEPAALRFTLHKSASLDALNAAFTVLALPRLYVREQYLVVDGQYRYPWEKGELRAAEKLTPEALDKERFAVTLPAKNALDYARAFVVRGCLEYTDVNGLRRALYTPECTASLTRLAPARYREAAREACLRPGTTPIPIREGEGDGTERAYTVNSNGVAVLEIAVASQKPATPPVEIIAWGDNHFKTANAEDAKNVNIMFAMKRRGSANPIAKAVQSVQTELEFASLFDQAMVLGDNVDFFTYGGLELWKRLVTDADPGLLAAVGFHDYVTYTINGRPEAEFDRKAAREFINRFYANDTVYASKVLGDKVMLIQLDNSRNGRYYWEDKIHERLAADLAAARKNGWILLLFQHEPLYLNTYPRNAEGKYDIEADKELCTRKGMVLLGANTEKVMNYAPSAGFFDGSENRAFSQVKGTQAVYRLITENGDLIRGIYHGHVHANYATRIRATAPGPEGKPVPAEIPQYSVMGSVFLDNGFVLRLKVK